MNSSGKVRPDTGAALLDLYDEALPEVYGYLLARCGGRPLAEDLTAETFLAGEAIGAPNAAGHVLKRPSRRSRFAPTVTRGTAVVEGQ